MKKVYDLHLPTSTPERTLPILSVLDAEKIFHLNPIWTIESFHSDNELFNATITNYATDEQFTTQGMFSVKDDGSIHITFESGDYKNLIFQEKEGKYTAEISYTDPEFREESDEEHHTVLWLRAIQEYLRLYMKKSLNSLLFRFIMNRIVLKMTPSQRKICLMLFRITIVELLVILLIVVGYVMFVLKPSSPP